MKSHWWFLYRCSSLQDLKWRSMLGVSKQDSCIRITRESHSFWRSCFTNGISETRCKSFFRVLIAITRFLEPECITRFPKRMWYRIRTLDDDLNASRRLRKTGTIVGEFEKQTPYRVLLNQSICLDTHIYILPTHI